MKNNKNRVLNNASEAVKYINSEELTTTNCVKIGNSANKLANM